MQNTGVHNLCKLPDPCKYTLEIRVNIQLYTGSKYIYTGSKCKFTCCKDRCKFTPRAARVGFVSYVVKVAKAVSQIL